VLTAFAGVASADPPSRVIRLSYVQGSVSFAPAGSDDWVLAAVNRPVFYGDRLWADEDGRTELELGDGTLWLGPRTALDVINLDDRVAQFQLSEGEVVLRVRRLDSNDTVEVDTPNLAFVVTRPGSYRVSVDAQGQSTFVAVSDGMADVYGERASYAVARGQRYRFSGTDLQDAQFIAPSPPDVLERFALDRERRHDRVASSRYVSPDVIGVEDLDAYGSWTTVADYGNVWVPRDVPQNWAPYRNGHWTWIDPWGWTWVDDAPWGFAPFHYGRWAYAQSRWCWVPGPANVRPVYAPALVAFFGGAGASVSVSTGPAIGWVPLGPREVYRPPYDASAQYIRQVNVSNTRITNVTVINNVINNPTAITQVNQYVNLRAPNAITAVPPAAMAQAQPVARAAVAVQAAAIDKTHLQAVAKVAPAPQAMTGAARAAQAKPPAQVMQRTVVAKSAPPPAAMPVQQKIQMLEKDPGKPLPPREAAREAAARAGQPAQAGAAAGARPSPNVRVVSAPKPAPTAAPPARSAAAQPEGKAPTTGAARAAPSAAAPRAAPTPPTASAPAQPPREEARTAPARPPAAQPPREEANGAPGPRPREEARSAPGRPPTAQAPREAPNGGSAARQAERDSAQHGVTPAVPSARGEAPAPRPPSEAARPATPARPSEAAAPPETARPAEAAAPREPVRPAQAAPPREAPRAPEAAAPRPATREEARSAPRPADAAPQREATPRAPAPPPPAAAAHPPAAERAAPPSRGPEARPQPEARPAPQAARAPEPAPRTEARSAPRGGQGRPEEKGEKGNEKEKRGNES
jgi:hypothetical protein